MGDYFYVDASGGQAGPVSTSVLQQKLKSGELNANSLVSRTSFTL